MRGIAAAQHGIAIPGDVHSPEGNRAKARGHVARGQAIGLDFAVGLIGHSNLLEPNPAGAPESALAIDRIGGVVGYGRGYAQVQSRPHRATHLIEPLDVGDYFIELKSTHVTRIYRGVEARDADR